MPHCLVSTVSVFFPLDTNHFLSNLMEFECHVIYFIYIFYHSGIVRAVDVSKGLLYVITPVAQHNLEKVDILLQGFIEIPTRLLQVIDPFSDTHLLWFF